MIHPADLQKRDHTYVMGILNITPDSFSGDGLMAAGAVVEAALKQAREFVAEGAHILDVGGESTRPGSETISSAEEIDRVAPVIQAIRKEMDITISVDTYKAEVAAAALDAGADWINDVWGLRADPDMAALAARHNAPLILMHNRSKPTEVLMQQRLGGMYLGADYSDLLPDICAELMNSVHIAHQAGVPGSNIILDPGIGFGKTVNQNMQLIDRLGEICELGYPVLLGPSRKSFIGYTLDVPPNERVEGTAAAVVVGILRGAAVIRVHDVKQMVRVVKMTDAILASSRST
ncbi:MAG: dihydropteroate synthase [Anaerolinea sp.]|nr:dihydropteroate synthase [Anaerolinea sp.]